MGGMDLNAKHAMCEQAVKCWKGSSTELTRKLQDALEAVKDHPVPPSLAVAVKELWTDLFTSVITPESPAFLDGELDNQMAAMQLLSPYLATPGAPFETKRYPNIFMRAGG